jgi:hypothetical protein
MICLSAIGLLATRISSGQTNATTLPPLFLPDPVDPAQAAIRVARGKLFNHGVPGGIPLDQQPVAAPPPVTTVEIGARPEFPTDFTDTIILGTIQSAQPYLSNDRRSVYTEYTVRVDEKIAEVIPLIRGDTLFMGEMGGIGRLPDGRVLEEDVRGLGTPLQVKAQYVLFLNYRDKAQYYRITKAWQLKNDRVIPTAEDDLALSKNGLFIYASMSAEQFLNIIRQVKPLLRQ